MSHEPRGYCEDCQTSYPADSTHVCGATESAENLERIATALERIAAALEMAPVVTTDEVAAWREWFAKQGWDSVDDVSKELGRDEETRASECRACFSALADGHHFCPNCGVER